MKKRILWCILILFVLLAITPSLAWAAPLSQEGEGELQDELWTVLAPLVAIATFTERVLEAIWERWEKVGTWPNQQGVANTGDPDYVTRKKLRSHWWGTAIAIVAVGLTNLRFFRLLGFDVLFSSPELMLFDLNVGGIFDDFTVGTLIDWLATAAVIGWGGTELTHSVIEGLVKGRNLWKEMQEVQEGRKSLMDAKFFNDYVAPMLEEKGVSVSSLRWAFQALCDVGASPDWLISSLTVGKAEEFLERLEAQPDKAEAVQAVRNLLEGMPPEQQVEIPNVLRLLTPDQRDRFLGATTTWPS